VADAGLGAFDQQVEGVLKEALAGGEEAGRCGHCTGVLEQNRLFGKQEVCVI
jgi:hypothetical protein